MNDIKKRNYLFHRIYHLEVFKVPTIAIFSWCIRRSAPRFPGVSPSVSQRYQTSREIRTITLEMVRKQISTSFESPWRISCDLLKGVFQTVLKINHRSFNSRLMLQIRSMNLRAQVSRISIGPQAFVEARESSVRLVNRALESDARRICVSKMGGDETRSEYKTR